LNTEEFLLEIRNPIYLKLMDALILQIPNMNLIIHEKKRNKQAGKRGTSGVPPLFWRAQLPEEIRFPVYTNVEFPWG